MSWQNEAIVRVALPLLGGKRLYSSAERTRRRAERRARRPARYAPPRGLGRRAEVSASHRHGWPLYELAPRGGAAAERHVLYLHGGAYVNEIVRTHWSVLGRLVAATPCRVSAPIYPLGAALGAERTVATATEIARELIEREGGERLVLMGDSAGGGMALAVAQALRDRDLRPDRVVLLAPWLDVAVDRPEQRPLEPRDAMLGIDGLQEAGRIYAGELPIDDPRVSPINGDMRGLPPLTVFIGSEDLLEPDSRRLAAACAAAAVPCELVEASGMPHVYPLMPTPEGAAARRRIVELLRKP